MATTVKKTTTAKPAAKKTAAAAKPAAKKTTTAKPAAKPVAKKTTAAKPAAKKTTATAKPAAAKPASGAEITVNGNKVMKTLQKEFSKKFEYLMLCFIVDADRGKSVNIRSINTDKRVSEVRKKVSTAEISIHGRTKVVNIENYFWKELGIACQIGVCNYNGHKYYFPIGDWFNGKTLTAANDWAKEANCGKVGAKEIAEISKGTIF